MICVVWCRWLWWWSAVAWCQSADPCSNVSDVDPSDDSLGGALSPTELSLERIFIVTDILQREETRENKINKSLSSIRTNLYKFVMAQKKQKLYCKTLTHVSDLFQFMIIVIVIIIVSIGACSIKIAAASSHPNLHSSILFDRYDLFVFFHSFLSISIYVCVCVSVAYGICRMR